MSPMSISVESRDADGRIDTGIILLSYYGTIKLYQLVLHQNKSLVNYTD